MSDDDVAEIAKKQGSTRAVASMEKACMLDKPLIFAIGNAPTALVRLYELIDEGKLHPCGIIGVPVGFVNVVEAKELIMRAPVPYIVARGRRAVAILPRQSAMRCSMSCGIWRSKKL